MERLAQTNMQLRGAQEKVLKEYKGQMLTNAVAKGSVFFT